jgi:hypothetical protein
MSRPSSKVKAWDYFVKVTGLFYLVKLMNISDNVPNSGLTEWYYVSWYHEMLANPLSIFEWIIELFLFLLLFSVGNYLTFMVTECKTLELSHFTNENTVVSFCFLSCGKHCFIHFCETLHVFESQYLNEK